VNVLHADVHELELPAISPADPTRKKVESQAETLPEQELAITPIIDQPHSVPAG